MLRSPSGERLPQKRPVERVARPSHNSAPRQAATPTPPPAPAPQQSQQRVSRAPEPAPTGRKKAMLVAGIIAAVVVLGLAGWYFMSAIGAAGMIDKDKHQAVFFSNGQVYFGKLELAGSDYYKLSDVFYIQSDEAATEGDDEAAVTEPTTEQKLIKRGAEVYGPEDPMVIDRSQVMFFENLKTDSEVAELIQDYSASNN